MSSGSYLQRYVKCPYYKRDDGRRRIECEGLIPRGAASTYFAKNAAFTAQMQRYCCANWERCPLAQAISRKYE